MAPIERVVIGLEKPTVPELIFPSEVVVVMVVEEQTTTARLMVARGLAVRSPVGKEKEVEKGGEKECFARDPYAQRRSD